MDGKDRVSVHKSHQFASVLFDLFQARRHVKQTSINSDKIIFKAWNSFRNDEALEFKEQRATGKLFFDSAA